MKEAVPMTVGNAFAYFLKKKKPSWLHPESNPCTELGVGGWTEFSLLCYGAFQMVLG